jgi:hypothetical protein
MEEIVLDTIRFIVFEIIDNDSIATEIRKVRKSIFTVCRLCVNNLLINSLLNSELLKK